MTPSPSQKSIHPSFSFVTELRYSQRTSTTTRQPPQLVVATVSLSLVCTHPQRGSHVEFAVSLKIGVSDNIDYINFLKEHEDYKPCWHHESQFFAYLRLSKEDKFNRKREQATSASLYTHPSLLQMKNERIANRTRVYEFLRSIGVVPDELDRLELPVTVEVMQERVDFLHKLGLTIEDINNYPLLLGCSVKKNMIPVLDYLGKLGVRKSTFTEFLHRYLQVLHASVVVDLAPVVKYLQGMDIKPDDVPRVLEKYPEVLGFKLEGTMSTSVAYLIEFGVARREIGGVLTKYPEILGMRVGRGIKPFVEYLESLGIPRLDVARLIEKRPHILGFGLEEQVKPNLKSLLDYHVRQTSLAAVITQYPEIIRIDLETKLFVSSTNRGSSIPLLDWLQMNLGES
ncbi:transcription termination factor MTERF4 [Forsythia ovata]|uniref:Transcription termination factor MTERF4 n=1 Tax=Forsythia ovata TaxID=205694 RepID=A0ABD1PYM5_9LAMI